MGNIFEDKMMRGDGATSATKGRKGAAQRGVKRLLEIWHADRMGFDHIFRGVTSSVPVPEITQDPTDEAPARLYLDELWGSYLESMFRDINTRFLGRLTDEFFAIDGDVLLADYKIPTLTRDEITTYHAAIHKTATIPNIHVSTLLRQRVKEQGLVIFCESMTAVARRHEGAPMTPEQIRLVVMRVVDVIVKCWIRPVKLVFNAVDFSATGPVQAISLERLPVAGPGQPKVRPPVPQLSEQKFETVEAKLRDSLCSALITSAQNQVPAVAALFGQVRDLITELVLRLVQVVEGNSARVALHTLQKTVDFWWVLRNDDSKCAADFNAFVSSDSALGTAIQAHLGREVVRVVGLLGGNLEEYLNMVVRHVGRLKLDLETLCAKGLSTEAKVTLMRQTVRAFMVDYCATETAQSQLALMCSNYVNQEFAPIIRTLAVCREYLDASDFATLCASALNNHVAAAVVNDITKTVSHSNGTTPRQTAIALADRVDMILSALAMPDNIDGEERVVFGNLRQVIATTIPSTLQSVLRKPIVTALCAHVLNGPKFSAYQKILAMIKRFNSATMLAVAHELVGVTGRVMTTRSKFGSWGTTPESLDEYRSHVQAVYTSDLIKEMDLIKSMIKDRSNSFEVNRILAAMPKVDEEGEPIQAPEVDLSLASTRWPVYTALLRARPDAEHFNAPPALQGVARLFPAAFSQFCSSNERNMHRKATLTAYDGTVEFTARFRDDNDVYTITAPTLVAVVILSFEHRDSYHMDDLAKCLGLPVEDIKCAIDFVNGYCEKLGLPKVINLTRRIGVHAELNLRFQSPTKAIELPTMLHPTVSLVKDKTTTIVSESINKAPVAAGATHDDIKHRVRAMFARELKSTKTCSMASGIESIVSMTCRLLDCTPSAKWNEKARRELEALEAQELIKVVDGVIHWN